MHLGLSEDQQFFRTTTRKFIEAESTTSDLRRLAGSDIGYDPAYWKRGAELGWTSLLVPESAGGGSIGPLGLVDLSLVAFEFGLHAAPGPLGPTNVVAGALGRAAGHGEALGRLVSGDSVAAWAWTWPTRGDGGGRGGTAPVARADAGGFVLDGTVSPVEAALGAELMLVTAQTDQGPGQFLVPSDAAGVTVHPLAGIDLTRRWARVELVGVKASASWRLAPVGVEAPEAQETGAGGPVDREVARQLDTALCVQLSEMVGAMQAAFDLTTEWAANRYSFGRPLASYQELKHRFADMRIWLEASYAITAAATTTVAEASSEASELVSAAKAYVGVHGPELVQDCVQIHGGIGVTFDHDLHLFLRRVSAGVTIHGSPADHRLRLAGIVAARQVRSS